MNLFKTTFLSIIVSSVKVISALVLNKVLAVYVGPAGYAFVGQLQNFITSISSLASAGVNNGIIKYTAEYKNNKLKQILLWKTSGTVSLCCTVFLTIILLLLSKKISIFLFSTIDYSYIIKLTAIFLFLYVSNIFLISILNGLGEVKRYAIVNISNSVFTLLVTAVFSYYWSIQGALISLSIGQSLVFFVTISLIIGQKWAVLSNFIGRINTILFKKIILFTIVTLITSLLGPVVQTIIRTIIIENHGLTNAGYWDALNRISNTYLLVITFPLITHFVPKVSSTTNVEEVKKIFFNNMKLLLPLTFIMGIVIYVFKNMIILSLFTENFLPMRNMFAWQLIGDFFRVGCWLFSYYFIAKAKINMFIIAEVTSGIMYLLFVYIFKSYDITLIPFGYFLSNICYLLIIYIYFIKNRALFI